MFVMKNCLPYVANPLFKSGRVRKFPSFATRLLFLISFAFLSSFLFAQQTIKGRVSSGDTALSGATIQVKGTATTTQTDANGSFTISAPPNATLVISYV